MKKFFDMDSHELHPDHVEILEREIQKGTYFGIPVELLGELYAFYYSEYPEVLQNLIREYLPETSKALILKYRNVWDNMLSIPVKWIFRRLGIRLGSYKPHGKFIKTIINESGSEWYPKPAPECKYDYNSDYYDSDTEREQRRKHRYRMKQKGISHLKKEYKPPHSNQNFSLVLATQNEVIIEAFESIPRPDKVSIRLNGYTTNFGKIDPNHNDIIEELFRGNINVEGERSIYVDVNVIGEANVNLFQILQMFPQFQSNIPDLFRKFPNLKNDPLLVAFK